MEVNIINCYVAFFVALFILSSQFFIRNKLRIYLLLLLGFCSASTLSQEASECSEYTNSNHQGDNSHHSDPERSANGRSDKGSPRSLNNSPRMENALVVVGGNPCGPNVPPEPVLTPVPDAPSDDYHVLAGTFNVSSSGQATYSIPIFHSPTGGGFGPGLSLEYNSGSGNGDVGYGWALAGLGKITRCRQTISQDGVARPLGWGAGDKFCLNGMRLLLEGGVYGASGSTYRMEIDRHAKITALGGTSGSPDKFLVEYKNGVSERYDVKHLVVNGSATKVYAWHLGEKKDSAENTIKYSYQRPGGGQSPRITIIDYAIDRTDGEQYATMEFSWEDRPDPILGFVAGYRYENRYRLKKISTGGYFAFSYNLHYSQDNGYGADYEDNLSRLVQISHCVGNYCGQPTRFEWPVPGAGSGLQKTKETESELLYLGVSEPRYIMGDISGDGLPDVVWVGGGTVRTAYADADDGYVYYTSQGVVGNSISVRSSSPLHLVDYDGDGRKDLITRPVVNNGPLGDMTVYFSRPQPTGQWAIETAGSITLDSGANNTHWTLSSFVDINGDGLVDTVDLRNKRVMVQKADQFGEYYPQKSITFNNQNAPPGIVIADLLPVSGDFNGDGNVDFIAGTNNGYVAYTSEYHGSGNLTSHYMGQAAQNIEVTSTDTYHVKVIDLNGDGLSDIVYQSGLSIHYRLSKGSGNFTAAKTLPMKTEWKYTDFVDRNADGYPDVVDLFGNPAPNYMYLSTRFWDPDLEAFRTYSSNTSVPFVGFPNTFRMLDANGDGGPDMITEFYGTGERGIRVIPGENSSVGNRIDGIRISDDLEADIGVAYESLGQSAHYSFVSKLSGSETEQVCQFTQRGDSCWERAVASLSRSALRSAEQSPFSGFSGHDQSIESSPFYRVFNVNSNMPVVTEVSRRMHTASLGNPGNTSVAMRPVRSYYYEQGRAQASGRGFLGFKKVVEVNRQTGMRKATTFRQDWPFSGRQSSVKTFSRLGTLVNESATAWGLANCGSSCLSGIRSDIQAGGTASAQTIQPFKKRIEEKSYDLDSGDFFGRRVNVRTMDAHGNLVTEVEDAYKSSGSRLLRKTTNNGYTLFPSGNYSMTKGRLTSRTITHDRGTSITREWEYDYYTAGSSSGLLKTEIVEPNKNEFTRETEHFYDAYGNRTQSNVTAGSITRLGDRTEYDDLGRYPLRVYGHRSSGTASGQTEYLKAEFSYYDKFGTPTKVQRYVNDSLSVEGIIGTTPLGKVYFQSDSTGKAKTLHVGGSHPLCPSQKRTYRTEGVVTEGSGVVIKCFDHQGREIRIIEALLNGALSTVDLEYDYSGFLVHRTRPYILNDGVPQWIITHYDVLGRVTEIENPDGSTRQLSYSSGSTSITNELGFSDSERKDFLGEVQNNNVAGPISGSSYGYNPRGNLREISGPDEETLFQYDILDRITKMSDADKGTWHYQYNAFGDMTCKTSAKGEHTLYDYDRQGRLFRLRTATGGSCGQPSGISSDVTWEYDTAVNGYGNLSIMTDSTSGYEQQYYYDVYGRVEQKRTRLRGVNNQLEDHYEKTTYNEYGDVFQIFDAARSGASYTDSGVEYIYQFGHLKSIVDAVNIYGSPREVYFHVDDVGAGGKLTEASYGEYLERTVEYDEETGRIANIRTKNGQLTPIQNLALDWDYVGNLTEKSETGMGSGFSERALSEQYEHDGSSQLVEWNATGLFQAQEDYTYDGSGNLRSKTGLGNYKYGWQCAASNAGPHAACEVDGTVYTYDNNGNVISDSDGGILEYNVSERPTRVTRSGHASRFYYAPDGSRYKREDISSGGTTTTLYIGNVEKVYYPDGTGLWRRYIGGVAVENREFNASGSETERNLYYLVKDHLGSVNLVTNRQGEVTHELYVDPWGQYREPQWDAGAGESVPVPATPFLMANKEVTQRAFTGHEHLDEVGIIHMNGRIYDPRLARFLQADPVLQDPMDARSLNRYSYIWNNPLNATDPTGFIREDERTSDAESFILMAEQREADAARQARRQGEVALFQAAHAMGSHLYDISLNGVSASSYSGMPAFSGMLEDALNWTVVGSSVESSGSCIGRACVTTARVTSVTMHHSTPLSVKGRAQESNPAHAVASEVLKDGHLALGEANSIWRANNDPNFEVTVDASQLSVKQTRDFNDNGIATGRVQGGDWFVHGSVLLSRDAQGNITLPPGPYDFQPHGSFWSRPVRNFETYGGFYVGSHAGISIGTDFLINYSGSPNVSR